MKEKLQWVLDCWVESAKLIFQTTHDQTNTHAINLLNWEQAKPSDAPTCSCAPIVQAFSRFSKQEMGQFWRKFDTAYFLAREKRSFRKCPCLCELEACHRASIGSSYTNTTVVVRYELPWKFIMGRSRQFYWMYVRENLTFHSPLKVHRDEKPMNLELWLYRGITHD